MKRYWRFVAALIGIVVGLISPPISSLLAEPDNHGVFPPDSHPFGASYGEWGARWWQWNYSIPLHVHPSANDPTGAQCGINQSGPVWFLAGTAGTVSTATRACTISEDKAIFFPIINIINDYPCPEPPPFEPAPGQSLQDFLTMGAEGFVNTVTSLEVELDGHSLKDLFDFRAVSKLFGFTGAIDLGPAQLPPLQTGASAIDFCVTGSPQLGVADGYWIMLKPLSVGSHTLHFKGASSGYPPLGIGPFSTEVTDSLSIVHGK